MLSNQGHAHIKISVDQIKKDLQAYLRRVEAGETLIITQAGKPIAEIKPTRNSHLQLRPYGLCAGEFTVPVDFDAPLPEDIIRDFEGK
jgi:prevent-host-death family protein